MPKFNFLLQILPLLERFEETTDPERLSISLFAAWLPENLQLATASTSENETQKSDDVDSQISWDIIDLYKYIKHHTKKVLEQTSIRSLEEYGFMRTLQESENLLKGELIQKNIVELTTGTDVLKRLMANQLIEEFPDENDKRAKRVKLTEKGHQEMNAVWGPINQITKLLTANLQSQDRKQLFFLLNNITNFQEHIFDSDRKSDWGLVWRKYGGSEMI